MPVTAPLENPVDPRPLYEWAAKTDMASASVKELRHYLHIARSWREYDANNLIVAEEEPTDRRFNRLLVEGAEDREKVNDIETVIEAALRRRG
jgi:hypothetical protein